MKIYAGFQGLKWIHNSALRFHGHLTGWKCLIDRHFTLKIGQFGYVRFRDMMSHGTTAASESIGSADHLFWTAPEVLRQEHLRDRASDIYSVGIIINEICSKALPFSSFPSDHNSEGNNIPWRYTRRKIYR